jgi:transposase InsO family protein
MAQSVSVMKEVAAKPVSVRPSAGSAGSWSCCGVIDLFDRRDRARSRAVRGCRRTRCRGQQHAQELDADIAELFDGLQQSNFCTNDLLFCRHSHTKTKSPQTNGICERFHQTAFNEFYLAFRKNVYRSPTSWRRIWLVDQSPMPHSGASRARGLTATAPPK